jgi:RNA polymerase sigma-70 factor (ECF subfamily)
VSPDEKLEWQATLGEASVLAFRVAFAVLRHREDAEDVAQEACVRAHLRRGTLRRPEAFRAWIVRVAWRLALDQRRGSSRRTVREDDYASERAAAGAGSGADETLVADRLWKAIDGLPETLRLALVLAAIEGHTMRDVAALTGVPEGTVKSRLFEARRLIREQWS